MSNGWGIFNVARPTCPHCDTPMQNTESLPSYEDGERDEIACAACGHTYEIRVRVIRSFNCCVLKKEPRCPTVNAAC